MIRYQTLETLGTAALLGAFNAAFADYQVSMGRSLSQFESLLKRNGCVLGQSLGAFDGERLIGFIINGIRDWNGQLTAYDSGTGILAEYRNQGISTQMLNQMVALLRQNQVHQYLLEVIQSNSPAVKLYQKQGFTVTREFYCYKATKADLNLVKEHPVELLTIEALPWGEIGSFGDYPPSWQNNKLAVSAILERCIAAVTRVDGRIAGYGICDRQSGAFYQLAVNQPYRRQGIATSLLATLLENIVAETVTFVNIDHRAVTMIQFLENVGFANFIAQYEMILQL